ncbi:nuclear transport factor 2 family protein [Nocardioides astragali]|uniref:Nuclear transport factor 2 family protein n=1 Tax=Nocardioides astragali TaxID=1776736 RepID=A0ABW2N4L6_9ACTN|nr:nuclear transport factor 2 family protein [Nocardioides astragali]
MSILDTARTYFTAIRDMDTVAGSLAEDVVWHQPGSNRFSGDHAGRDAVFAMLGQMMQVSAGSFASTRSTA